MHDFYIIYVLHIRMLFDILAVAMINFTGSVCSPTVKAIRDITPDSTIGFGSFVDKPTEPYILSK